MPKEIKTKTIVKDIKILDKAVSGTAHVKNAVIKSRDAAEGAQDGGYDNAEGYASDKIESGGNRVASEISGHIRPPKNKGSLGKAGEHFQDAKRNLPKQRKQAAEQAKQTADTLKDKTVQARKAAEQAKKAVTDAKHVYRQTRQAGRSIKTSAKTVKATGKGTIKTARQTVKTAQRSAKTAVKTAQQTAKATQAAAKASAKAARLAAQASKAAAKVAVQTAKAAAKAVVALVKAAIAAVKGLVALIAAGGWVAVLIIVIICLIALILGSVFGIFFSGSTDGAEGRSVQSVMSELNNELLAQAEEIKKRETYDALDVEMFTVRWPEVLAVYAVKVNSDPDNPDEVVTLTDEKVETLRGVFGDMVSLSHSLETEEQERIVTDEAGNETTETVTVTTLVIKLEQKSAADMAAQYGFSQSQMAQLNEILDPQYDDMWNDIAV